MYTATVKIDMNHAAKERASPMPAPRKLPDNTVLLKLREKGMTYAEIAEQYNTTEGAVYWQLRDAGGVKTRPDHSKFLPWKVKSDHSHARPAVLLRYLSRREQGDKIPEAKDRQVTRWLEEMKEADVVVCYDRDMPPNPASPVAGGFYYSKRRPEDGTDIIRCAPEDADDTSKVKKFTRSS
jgi:hypothetical protein